MDDARSRELEDVTVVAMLLLEVNPEAPFEGLGDDIEDVVSLDENEEDEEKPAVLLLGCVCELLNTADDEDVLVVGNGSEDVLVVELADEADEISELDDVEIGSGGGEGLLAGSGDAVADVLEGVFVDVVCPTLEDVVVAADWPEEVLMADEVKLPELVAVNDAKLEVLPSETLESTGRVVELSELLVDCELTVELDPAGEVELTSSLRQDTDPSRR